MEKMMPQMRSVITAKAKGEVLLQDMWRAGMHHIVPPYVIIKYDRVAKIMMGPITTYQKTRGPLPRCL